MCRHLKWIALGSLLLTLAACGPTRTVHPPITPGGQPPAQETPPVEKTPPSETIPHKGAQDTPPGETETDTEVSPNPRAMASLELTEQGRVMIESNRPDAAIRVLERAINLYPQNGQNYYYLAEAWLKKGNIPQAREFHRLAGIYLRDDMEWSSRLKIHELKIKNY